MNNFKIARQSKKLKQSAVAAELDVTAATVSRYESGDMQPDNNTLIKLADLFDCSIDYLLGRDANGIALSDDEIKLIKKYRQLDADGKNLIQVMINTRLQQLEKTSNSEAI
jgi:transcriptional regulator with XRE-family HTH domain